MFAGIGGIDLGLERTGGFRTAWFSEIEPFANAVLRKHWPDVPNLGDVRDLGEGTPYVDLIAAGFPCQPFSLAGKRLAQEDPRWLWPHVARRLVGHLRPRYVLLENVPGLRSKGLGDVLQDLSALGYDAEWEGISAAAVGAPHRRDRVWIVAYPHRERSTERGVPEGQGRQGIPGPPRGDVVGPSASRRSGGRQGQGEVSDPQRSGLQGSAGSGEQGAGRSCIFATRSGERSWEAFERELGRAAHGVPAWLDGSWEHGLSPLTDKGAARRTERLRALGNAVVPQVVEVVGRLILADAARA